MFDLGAMGIFDIRLHDIRFPIGFPMCDFGPWVWDWCYPITPKIQPKINPETPKPEGLT
jgi:hypothetical protein